MTKRAKTILAAVLIVLCLTTLFFVTTGCTDAVTGTASSPSIKGDDGTIKMTAVRNNTKVDVTVRLEKNPGVNAMVLTLDYDTSVMTLTGLDKGSALSKLDLITTNTATEKGYSITPFKFDYLNNTLNDTSTGVMFTLHFSLKKTSAKSTTVGLTYTDGNIKSLTNSGIVSKTFSVYPAIVSLS